MQDIMLRRLVTMAIAASYERLLDGKEAGVYSAGVRLATDYADAAAEMVAQFGDGKSLSALKPTVPIMLSDQIETLRRAIRDYATRHDCEHALDPASRDQVRRELDMADA